MTDEEIDISSIIETYLKSRASEFSRFFQGLPHMVLTFFSITAYRKRKFARFLSTYEGKFKFIAIITISLSLIGGISTIGLLKNTDHDTPILTQKIHSGVWGTIPPTEESTKEFTITNTHDKPITLVMNYKHWNSFNVQDKVTIYWDYDRSIIPPNQSIEVNIIVTNLDNEHPTTIALDIILYGFEI